jgi:hypothetical protein
MEEFENPIEYEFRKKGKELFDMFQLGKTLWFQLFKGMSKWLI